MKIDELMESPPPPLPSLHGKEGKEDET